MKLKNYTTRISSAKTIIEIERLLVGFGAEKIQKEYLKDGSCIGLAFIVSSDNRELLVKLPANVNKVLTVLYPSKHGRAHTVVQKKKAGMVAWRVLKDWIHAQLSLVKIGQAEATQIFLPYMWDGKQTFYEKIKQDKFLAIAQSEVVPEVVKDESV